MNRLKSHAGVSEEVFEQILKSHVVNPECMYKDDFNGFFNDRKEQILQRIEKAMGKAIARDTQALEEGKYLETLNDIEENVDE